MINLTFIIVSVFLGLVGISALIGIILFIRSVLAQRAYEKTNLPEIFEDESVEKEPETVFALTGSDEENFLDDETKKIMKEAKIKPTVTEAPRRAITNPFKK